MSNATNLSKLANLLDDGTSGQALVSDGASNVAFETLSTSNVSEGTNLYFTDERVQTKLGSVSGNVVPDTNVAYDLGSAAYAFKDLYLSGSTISLGSLQLSDNGGSLEVSPAGGGSAEPFATETYVTTQVNNLVDAAPGTLDTLNELAAALGDDANFSTTVTNSIAAKANTASLATVATSGSFSDLTNKPTTIAGYGITDAGSGGGGNVVEYTSTNTAATNDIVMLNSDGTVTVVEPTNYPFDQQTAIDSQMTSGYIGDLNYRGMIAHHSTREKGMLIFPGGTGHNDRTMLVVFSRNGSGISKGTAFSSGEPISNFRDQHAFFGPAGTHEDKFLYLGAATSGGNINVGTGNITGTTVNTTGTDSSAAYSNTTNNGQLNIGLNGRMVVDHGGFNGTVLTFYVKFENSNNKAAVRKFTYDFANQNLDYSFPEIETSSSETFEWEHTAIDPSTPTRIALYRQEGVTSTRRGIIKFADVDWNAGTINIGPSADLFTRSGSHNVDAWEIQNKQAFHPTNGLLAAVTTSPPDGGGDAPYRLKVALYSADANLSITNVSGNLTLMNGANVKVGTVLGNIAWTKGSNTGSTPNAPILITPIISNQTGSSPQTRYLQYDNSGNYITQTTDSNTFDSGSMWTYSSPFNDGDTASYSPDTVNSQYPQVIMTQGPYGESNFDATKLHGVAASAGTTIDVTLEYGIHTGLSGLTTGTRYFVTDSGGISTSGSAKLGTAINATSLALDFTDELTSTDLGTYATKAYVGTEISIKANTADLSTVATSGSYNDLTNQPTIPTNNNQLTNGAGFITAADVPNANTVEYTSTPSASVDDVVMLNSDGTVTPVEVTTFSEQLTNQGYNGSYQQLLPNSQGYTISNTNGLVAADKGYWLFPTQTDNKYISIAFDEAPGSVFEMKIVSVEYNSSNQTWTYGTEYQDLASLGNSLGLDKSDNPYVIGSPDNPDKFLILGPKLSADLIIHAVGTMAGSGITWSDTGTNTSNGGHTYASRLDHINWYYDHAGSTAGSYKVIGAYRDNSSNCRIFRITWDGNTTIQYSDDFTIPHPIDSRSLDFSKLTEGRFAGVDYSGNLRIGDIDWGTGNITVGTAYGLTSFNTNFGTDAPAHVAWRDSSEHFVVAWSVGGGSNSLKLRAFSTTGNSAVAEGSEYSLGYNQGGTYGHLSGNMAFYKNSNMFALTNAGYYYLSNTSNSRDGSFITHFSVNASLNIVIGTSRVTHGSNYYAKNTGFGYPGKIQMDPFRSGKGSISAPGNTDATNLVVKLFAQPTQGVYVESNLDASKVHGIAASAGTTIDVTVEGGIHTGLSGLTTGSKYYVLSDGSLSTTPDTNNAKVGLAMSSTTLAVDLLDELTSADLGTYATKSYVASQVPSLTGYATENYVDTEIANLVDSAPATLDTLNELAAALGDDANFSTTITNSLANKANTSSLATVATSGSYNDLTNQPTIPTNNNQLTNGANYITAADVPNTNTIEYTSTTSASVNDVVMLNTDGTVTPVEVTTYTDSLSLGGEYEVQENNGWSSSSTDVYNGYAIASRPGRIFPTGIDNKFILAGYDGIGSNNQEAVAIIDWTGSQWSYGQKYVVGTEMASNSSYFSVSEYSAPFILGSLVNTNKFLYLQKRQEAFSGGVYRGDYAYGFGTISGSTISWTSATDAGFGYESTWNEKIVYDFAGSSAGNYKFIIMYTRADDGSGTRLRLVRGTWDGTSSSVSFSNEITIDRGIDPRGVGFSSITEGRFAAVSGSLNGGPQAGDLEIFDVDWDNGTYTVGNATTPASIYTGTSMPAKVAWDPTNDKFVVAWLVGGSGGTNVDNLRYRTYEANGTTPSTYGSERNFGEDRFEFANGDFTFLSGSSTLVHTYIRQFTQFSSTHDAGYIRSMKVASNGTITNNQETQTSNGGNYGSASHVRDNGWRYEGRIVVDPHRKGMGTRLDPRTHNSSADSSIWVGMNIRGDFVESSLDATKLHGIAASSGTTIDVSVDGSIHNQLTGLIADQVYYVVEDGTLSTTPDTHNARVGVSLSNTAIKVSLLEILTSADLATKANTADLSTVATSGSYNDLTNQPTIPSLTGYATETYVNTATANLVDSAPATLNTLNELAAALGDDANFSTTILAQLGTVSANTISNASNINTVQANLSASASTAAVTVSGGNFYIDGAQQATISLEPGRTYKFDQSDSTNSSHPLRFSTTSDGTHGGGSEYTTGVTTSGTAGSASAYVQIAVDNSTPALYYYCANHGGMGASVAIGNPFNTDELTEGTSNLYYTDARVDARISANVALADLNNVSNTAPADGQALIWNTSQSNWAPANVASEGSSVSVSDTAPSSPSNGDQWFNSADGSMYIYYADGSSNQWVSVSGPAGSSVSVGTTPPSGAANGDQWFNSDSATLYVYYADGSSSQWVAVSGPRGPQGPTGGGVTTGKAIAMSIVFG